MAKLSAYGQIEEMRMRRVIRPSVEGLPDYRVTIIIMQNGRILKKCQTIDDVTGRWRGGSWKVRTKTNSRPLYRTKAEMEKLGYQTISVGGVPVGG